MKKIKIKPNTSKRIKQGYPLINSQDLVNANDLKSEKVWVEFVDQNNQFLGKGYLGPQNKGAGWVVITQKTEEIAHDFFAELFTKAKEKRQSYFNSDITTAFRLFNGEGDGFGGMTIDIYEEYAVFSWYNESIYHFSEFIIGIFSEVFPNIVGIYEKIRYQSKDLPESRFVTGTEGPEPLLVKENNITYATYLNEGLMTGIFLDQKEVRGRLAKGMAKGLSVLNTFSYTGAFSVAAAMGGAKETVSVDLAKRSLPKTQEMFAVNGLSLDSNRIVVMDVFDYFNYAKRKSLSFDMIILDPPSFARSKKRTFSVAKNYGELVAEVSDLLNDQGQLIASTNAANVSLDKYQQMIEDAFTKKGKSFKKIGTHRLPADFETRSEFPDGNYLKVIIYQVFS